MLTLVQAHTHGVNWQLWAAISGPIGTFLLALGRGVWKALRKLDQLGEHLADQDKGKASFEKEVLLRHQAYSAEQASTRRALSAVSERVARLEGPVQRTEAAMTAANGGDH